MLARPSRSRAHQHVAGAGGNGQQRVIAPLAGIAVVAGALLSQCLTHVPGLSVTNVPGLYHSSSSPCSSSCAMGLSLSCSAMKSFSAALYASRSTSTWKRTRLGSSPIRPAVPTLCRGRMNQCDHRTGRGGACECPTTTSTGASSCHAPPYPIHITPLGTSLYTDRASGLPGPDLLEQMEILIERS